MTTKDRLDECYRFAQNLSFCLENGKNLPSSKCLITEFSHLLQGFPLNHKEITSEMCFVRGRVFKEYTEVDKLSSLLSPPKEKCYYNRCNFPGNQMLYAGIDRELIFSEIDASPGDYVVLLYLRPNKSMLIADVCQMDKWRRQYGGMDLPEGHKEKTSKFYSYYNEGQGINFFFLDAFIRSCFTKTGNEKTYKITSSYVYSVLRSLPNTSGVMYDSVEHSLGSCVAFKPDCVGEILDPVVVRIAKIESNLGYGLRGYCVYPKKGIIEGENIIWK